MDLLQTRHPRLLLIAFCLAIWLPGLFSMPATDRDESRFAQASKQMIETGDYVRIMNGSEARNRKPIGIYWLQVPFAALARSAGVAVENPIWPYRMPSLLGGLVAVLAVQGLGAALVGQRAALLGAGMLAASAVLVGEVHLAKTDAALLAATTVCLGLLGRAYVLPRRLAWWEAVGFWLALGAGVLLKGPVTPMVAGLTAGGLVVWDRQGAWLRHLRATWGLPLMAAVVLPWFIAIGLATHGGFFIEAAAGDLGRKLVGGDDAHGGPPGLHLVLLVLLAFPSSFAAFWGLWVAWGHRDGRGVRFLLAWIVPAWLVFELIPTKLPHYTLPLYPAVFLLGAQAVLGPVPAGRWRWVAARLPMLVGAVFAGLALASPIVIGASFWIGVPAAVAAGLTGYLATNTGRPLAAFVGMILFTLAYLGWEAPRAWPLWLSQRVELALVAGRLQGRALGAVGYHEPSLMFIAGTATAMLADPGAAAVALADGAVAVVLVSDRDDAAFLAATRRLGFEPRPVAAVSGFNYSIGRKSVLSLFER